MNVSKPTDWHQAPEHSMHFDITFAQVSYPGHKTIDMHLEERHISKQIHSLVNIA